MNFTEALAATTGIIGNRLRGHDQKIDALTARIDTLEAAQRPASAPEDDATGPQVQRQPGNRAGVYGWDSAIGVLVAEASKRRAADLAELRNELAALKARRCDGCAHSDADPFAEPGGLYCTVMHSHYITADHACNDWTPKP